MINAQRVKIYLWGGYSNWFSPFFYVIPVGGIYFND